MLLTAKVITNPSKNFASKFHQMTEAILSTKLSCGATVLTEHMPGLRSATVGIWIKRGSRHETPDFNGICHFIEHAVFKGTERRSVMDIAVESDRLGGNFDAYTSHEMTGFALKVVDRAVPQAFDLLSDMLLSPRFDERELEREQKVIIEEMKMVEDSPEEYLGELFHAAYFPDHALGRPIEGTPETVSSFDRARTIEFHRAAYYPRNFVIAAAGNVSHAELVELAERAFAARAASPGEHSSQHSSGAGEHAGAPPRAAAPTE